MMKLKHRRKKGAGNAAVLQQIMPVLTAIAVLLVLLIRIPLTDQLTAGGNAYLSTAMEWFFLFLIVGMGGLYAAVSRMVTLRMERGNTENAKKVVTVSVAASFVLGLFLSAVLYFAADLLAGRLTGTAMAVPALQCFAVSVLPLCLMFALMGGLDGFGFSNTASFPAVLTGLIWFFAGITLTGRFREYGDSVGALLKNPQYGPAYAAFGCAAGLAAAAWIGFLTAALGWLLRRKNMHALSLHEYGSNMEQEKHMLKGIFHARLCTMFTEMIPFLCLIVMDILFQHSIKADSASKAQDWGAYTGFAGSILNVFLFLVISFSVREFPGLRICFEQRNLKRCREKLMITLRCVALFSVPLAVLTAVLGKTLTKLCYGEQALPTTDSLLLIGGFSVFFFGLAAVLGSVLWSRNQEKLVPMGIAVSGIVSLFICGLLLSCTELGILAVIWANLVWGILLFFLYYAAVLRSERIGINWIRILLPPVIGAAFMALVCAFLAYFIGQIASPAVTVILCAVIAVCLYFVAETSLHGITPRILREFPGGEKILMLARMLRLM